MYLEYVHLRKYKVKKYDKKFFKQSIQCVRTLRSSLRQFNEEHPLSRFIFYSLDFYEIVNHALWYYYIAYLVYCYCYVTTIRNTPHDFPFLLQYISIFIFISSYGINCNKISQSQICSRVLSCNREKAIERAIERYFYFSIISIFCCIETLYQIKEEIFVIFLERFLSYYFILIQFCL